MQKIMKKMTAIFLVAVSLCPLFGCTSCKKDEGLLIEQNGESTVLKTNLAPDKLDSVEKVAYALIDKLNGFSSFEAESEGTTEASIVTQEMESKLIKKDGGYYLENYSESVFVHTKHCAFFKDGKVAYNPSGINSENLNVEEESAYKSVYGVSPCDSAIFGYVMNKDTILSAEKVLENGEELTYKFVLDGNKAGANVKIQMKRFGGLNDYPSFKETVLLITLKKDWTPISVKINCKYSVSFSFFGNISCKQELLWNFVSVNGEVEVPHFNVFNEKINGI